MVPEGSKFGEGRNNTERGASQAPLFELLAKGSNLFIVGFINFETRYASPFLYDPVMGGEITVRI